MKKKDCNKVSLKLAAVLAAVLAMLLTTTACGAKAPAEPPQTTGASSVKQEVIALEEEIPESMLVADVCIETPYVNLYFPGQWAAYLETKMVEDEIGCTVQFYGKADGQEQFLFAISFGGAVGEPVGIYETADGYGMDITAELVDFTPADAWTQAQTDTFSAMQEALNYVLDKLAEEPGFAPV